MKRIIMLIMVMISFVVAVNAQRPLVTLSHNGELSFFSNLSALEDAINKAENGDIIYLSEGQFTTTADTIKITKRLSFIGCGYDSRIMTPILVNMKNNTAPEMKTPLFDGLQLATLKFLQDTIATNSTINAEIRKCYIRNLYNPFYAAKNFIIDRCYLSYAYFDGLESNQSNLTVQNSKIFAGHSMYYITIINCNVYQLSYLPKIAISSILGLATSTPGGSYNKFYLSKGTPAPSLYNSFYMNSYWTDNNYNGKTGFAKAYNCYYSNINILDEKVSANVDLGAKGYLGEDGRRIGIYGGEFPFSENPSVPTVDSEKSSVEYDADANKLKVTITVKEN